MILDKDVFIKENALYIGSKFELEADIKECRLAFSGNVMFKGKIEDENGPVEKVLPIKISRRKERFGTIEKVLDSRTLLVKNIFKKETNLAFWMDKDIYIQEIEAKGKISSSFGKTGKVKVSLVDPIDEEAQKMVLGYKIVLPYEKFMKIK
jgi:selenocysteine-specific elongation factor